MEEQNQYNRDGYFLFKKVFKRKKILDLSNLCHSSSDIFNNTNLQFVKCFTDKKIIECVKSLLGSNIIFFGDASIRYDDKVTSRMSRHFHIDARGDNLNFNNDYGLLRLGIYFNDYSNYGGGLKVRKGSHKTFCFERFGVLEGLKHFLKYKKLNDFRFLKSININSQGGDILAWNGRTHHSGYAVRLKFAKNFVMHPIFENIIPKFLQFEKNDLRNVIFLTYGIKNQDIEKYIKERKKRDPQQYKLFKKHYNKKKVIQMAERAGVELLF